MSMNTAPTITYPNTYEVSEEQFQDQFKTIQQFWLGAEISNQSVSDSEDLSISWISAEAQKKPEKALIITSGLHGIEGYIGAVMRSLFIGEYLDQLDPDTTGILLVHPINPWGMKHNRRVNAENVDLNRNFMATGEEFQEDYNPDYIAFDSFLNPKRRLRPLWLEIPNILLKVIINLIRFGVKGLRGAVLLGQGVNPEGLYYGGSQYQPETLIMRDLIRTTLGKYPKVLHIDLHTGYGPTYQMGIVNSPAEERTIEELKEAFNYPLIVNADPDQFFSIKGDMVNWVYQLQQSNFPGVRYYGMAFEFGVHGESILNEIKSLWTMIFENQLSWRGVVNPKVEARTKTLFREMYYPSQKKWREKALVDCQQGFQGVLEAEGFIKSEIIG